MQTPTMDRIELRAVYEQAALWMLRKQEGALSAIEQGRYEAWLELPHRAEALQQMEALSKRLEEPWRRRRIRMRLLTYEARAVSAAS